MTPYILSISQLPSDGGPIYAETDLSAYFVEPWNSISSFAIIIPAIYWMIKLRWQIKSYPFIYLCTLFLFVGGWGSVLYHAFRSSNGLLMMDVLPAAVLTIIIGLYFWNKVFKNWYKVILVVGPFVVFRFILFEFLENEMAVNVGYFISGTMFFLPMLIYLREHNFRHVRDIFLSIGFLFASLIFRETDQLFGSYLPMGSHFLWHLLSGIGAYFLGLFLYKLRKDELSI